MVTEQEVQTLLADLESDRVERTTSVKDTDKFCRAICAFANDMPNHRRPGYLIIGADDQGQVTGTPITDALLQNLGAIRSDGLVLPLPALQVAKIDLPGGSVAVVEVQPSDMPPVRYRGRVCIRCAPAFGGLPTGEARPSDGPRRGEANEQEERILSERRSLVVPTFDLHPVPDAPISALSQRLFDAYRAAVLPREVIEANHRTPEEAMAALRCFDLQRDCATVAGLLLFGHRPRHHLPGAYVQFLKFPGTRLTDLPIDQTEIAADLPKMVDILHTKIIAYNRVRMEPGEAFKDRIMPDYPEWALRELLNNALVHRDYAGTAPTRFYWYSDRIEIANPGGLHGHLTSSQLRRRNSYRNPVLAEAFKELGYVNKFGFGLQRVDELLANNHNPPLEIEADATYFQATVRARPG